MNLRDLQYLVALSDEKHFGKAAKACFVSQPALSMQIKKLETYLGVKLLERTNKSVMLTEWGMILANHARGILNQVDEMREMARQAADPYAAELKLGIIPTLAPYLLPQIMPLLTKTFPRLRLFLIEEQTHQLVDKLKQGKMEAAILALPLLEPGLSSSPLFEEDFLLAVPNSHHLAKRKRIKQTELANSKLLLLEEGHCLREQALALCTKVDAAETSDFRATSLETLRYMVAAGAGITLMPQLACRPDQGINYISFHAPAPSRTVGMVWRSSTAKQILLKEMIDCIKQAIL